MSICRVFLVLLLSATTISAAEIKTLKGDTFTGDVVSITDQEMVFNTAKGKVTLPLKQVLNLKLGQPEPLGDLKYIDVELSDGTMLHCANVTLKEKQAQLHLLQGQVVTVPLSSIIYILNEAHVQKNRQEFQEKVIKQKGSRDILAVKSEDVVNIVEGTLGDADAEGKTIAFTLAATGQKADIPVQRPFALYFVRKPDLTLKPRVCKILDTSNNLIFAHKVAYNDEGYEVVTCGGAVIKYAKTKVANLDYSTGKLTYLSQMNPTDVKETSTEGSVQHYRRDQNLDGGRIRLASVVYEFGLALHSHTELEYNLDGEYREFKAVVGIDDEVGGDDGPAVLKLFGDGTELLSLTISRKDKMRTHDVLLNIKDVRRLRIVVTTGDILDLGKHITLANARVTK